MNFDEFKEKVINYGYGFMEANDGLMATVKSGVFDTDFYVFINSDEVLYNGKEVIRVKYKCAKTNNIFSNCKYVTQDINYIMYEYKDFVDSLKALDKIYSLILIEFANPDAYKK